jgi:3-hydroxyisobutyrate dehydrogenase-like beta-hydroxyacid dehydrogenase
MKVIGLVGAGHMGSGLGWALREGGHDVITSLSGRSPRTARLATEAGLRIVPRPVDVLAEADVILVVTPPGAAVTAASEIAALAATVSTQAQPPAQGQPPAQDGPLVQARPAQDGPLAQARPAQDGPLAQGRPAQDRPLTQAWPLVVDLNAISPPTAAAAAEVIAAASLDFVDGSISGPPPTVRPGAAIYLSGPRADEVADLSWRHVKPVVVGDRVGAASAVKMSTASVYKGLTALMAQAIRSASTHGVLETVMADLGESLVTPYEVALASTKAHRYVAEMQEIARSQAAAGLTPALFEAVAEVWADIADRPLADDQPETLSRDITAEQVAEGLRD